MTEQPSQEPRPQLDLAFTRRHDRTVLSRRLFRWPFVLTRTFALDRAPGHMLTVILQTGSGAVHGEDRLGQHLHVGPGAAAHVTTQGATAVHRAASGTIARERVAIRVEAGGVIEYLPEPRILFPDAALESEIAIDVAPGGIALVSDAFTIHDPDRSGRTFRRLAASTVLRCGGGEPVLVDRLDIDGMRRGRTAEFTAFASLLLAMPGRPLEPGWADTLSAALTAIPGLYGSASSLPADAGVGVRLAGRDLRAVRAGQNTIWVMLRQALYDAGPVPRLVVEDEAH